MQRTGEAEMSPELAKKYAKPVPRYTSYPTAAHFSAAVDAATYAGWLAGLSEAQPLSLYVHIPFCDSLCWYCGCNTKMVNRYDPVAKYVDTLLLEIDATADPLHGDFSVSHVHLGGGSPSILKPDDIARLADRMRARFTFEQDMEFAVEVDPRYIDEERIAAFAAAGVTRVSFGVQDFNPLVQDAINRQQSFAQTRDTVAAFRQAGVTSVNIDLVYGLPHQTVESVGQTIAQVLELVPDRIALFGYAHLPARLTHQRLIDSDSLPGSGERLAQSDRAAGLIADAGYVRVGLDHFAKPGDQLAAGTVKRNFQGYTKDAAETLLGLGASAIGQLPQGYVQNAVPTGEYTRCIAGGGLATARGVALSDEDRARGFVINRLMCDLGFSTADLRARFDGLAEDLVAEAQALVATDTDGLLVETPSGFAVTERGRPFVRTICSRFDAYLAAGAAQYSTGV